MSPRATLYCGDVLDVLGRLPEESVQSVVTSPPYWGLRDYGVAGAIGHEPTVGSWVERLVDVFRQVRRVLRPNGTLWVNLGDAYCSGTTNGRRPTTTAGAKVPTSWTSRSEIVRTAAHDGLKAKDLIGQPWRLALALQADGWWLRRDIIWHKPNPAPETVRDRPTGAHEYLFLFSRSARYFYDAAAAREPATGNAHARRAKLPSNQEVGPGAHGKFHPDGRRAPGVTPKSAPPGSGVKANESYHAATVDVVPDRNWRSVWTIQSQGYPGAHFATFPEELARRCILAGSRPGDTVLDPFAGSGTVAQVATGHGRDSIYIDLNPKVRRARQAADRPDAV